MDIVEDQAGGRLTATLQEMVTHYRKVLANPSAAKAFDARLSACAEAARAEAVAYDFLDSCRLQPTILEDPSHGGTDFECSFGDQKFAVEVTAVTNTTASTRSGVDHNVFSSENQVHGAAFYVNTNLVVRTLSNRISAKGRQARRYQGARVLVIASEHPMASVFFDVAARDLLTGNVQISFPVGPHGAAGEEQMTTTFENAAHLRFTEEGAVESFRREYALTLLMAVGGGDSLIQGVINPQPEIPLSIDAFPKVPFARLRSLSANEFEVEWIVSNPSPFKHYFIPHLRGLMKERSREHPR